MADAVKYSEVSNDNDEGNIIGFDENGAMLALRPCDYWLIFMVFAPIAAIFIGAAVWLF